MKRRLSILVNILVVVAIVLSSCTSCNPDAFTSDSTSSGTANNTTYSGSITVEEGNSALYPSTYDESDYTAWQNYDFGTEYVFDVESKTWVGTSPADAGIATVTVKSSSLKVVNSASAPISIRLTGSNDSFKVTIEGNDQAVKVSLDDLSLTSTDRCLNIKSSSVSYVVLEGDNVLETLIDSEDKNVIKSAADLVFDGEGSLSVTANSKNGIVSDHVICILDGDITVTVAETTRYTDEDTGLVVEDKGTGIKALLGFVMLDGNLTIYGNNSTEGYESKGIKVDGFEADTLDDESEAAGMGWIVIDGGNITIRTQGKAISAGWKQSEDDLPDSTSNYPVPNVYINDGAFDIITYATPRDDTDTTEGVSPEGIEAKNNVYITGGTFVINTTDDCINASNAIYISGGLVYAHASQNDAIDAGADENQGYLYISGGAVIAMGAGQPETGFDCNSDSRFQYTGGVFIAMGGGQNNTPQATGTTAYTVSINEVSSGKTYALVQDGDLELVFKVPAGYSYGNCVLLGTEGLSQGTATLLSGVTATGTETLNGVLIYGAVTVSGGTSTSVTVSNSSSSQMGGGFGGGPGRPF